jgi:collagenase-like PrtC family protease
MNLKKRFTLGLTLLMENSEFKQILDEFHPYIAEIYFSPPLGTEFQTRTLAHMDDPASKERILDILVYASSLGIEADFLLNSTGVPGNPRDLHNIYLEYASVVPVPRITLLNVFLARTLKDLIPGVRINISFNADIHSSRQLEQLSILGVCDEVVFGRSQMRDFALIREAKERYGFKTHLLINNGCIPDCISACRQGGYCDFFYERLASNGRADINELYAESTIFPEELHCYFDREFIDVFKLSTRDCTYGYLRSLLSTYIRGKHEGDPQLYGRITAFARYAHLLDLDLIFIHKKKIYERKGIAPAGGTAGDISLRPWMKWKGNFSSFC